MIFVNFWEAFRITSFLGLSGVFPDTEEIVPYIPLCLFPFSLSFLKRGSHQPGIPHLLQRSSPSRI